MHISQVNDIIGRIADGFEQACLDCMHDNAQMFPLLVRDQLWSGLDGQGKFLSPDYLTDPYFTQRYWFHSTDDNFYEGAEGYKRWKMDITPPGESDLLGLPPRPENIPNLFIDGTFYASIQANATQEGIEVFTTGKSGPDIVNKYGSQILTLTEEAVEWFNREFLIPHLDKFFKDCGYR